MTTGASAQQSNTYTVVIESAKKNDGSQVCFLCCLCVASKFVPLFLWMLPMSVQDLEFPVTIHQLPGVLYKVCAELAVIDVFGS
jgi:hypothetical protein